MINAILLGLCFLIRVATPLIEPKITAAPSLPNLILEKLEHWIPQGTVRQKYHLEV